MVVFLGIFCGEVLGKVGFWEEFLGVFFEEVLFILFRIGYWFGFRFERWELLFIVRDGFINLIFLFNIGLFNFWLEIVGINDKELLIDFGFIDKFFLDFGWDELLLLEIILVIFFNGFCKDIIEKWLGNLLKFCDLVIEWILLEVFLFFCGFMEVDCVRIVLFL